MEEALKPVTGMLGCARIILLLVALPLVLRAQERQYVFGVTMDVVGGARNERTVAGLAQGALPLSSYYGAYPSVILTSPGARSTIRGSYSFGAERSNGDPSARSDSHDGSFTFSKILSRNLNVSLSESLQISSDATTFNAVRGVTPPAENFSFLFNPVSLARTSRNNNVGVLTSYTLSDSSALSVNATHSLRSYGSGLSDGALTNQQRISGSLSYTKRTTSRDSWGVDYTGSYYNFGNFENAHSDTVGASYSNILGAGLTLRMTVGASQVRNLGSGNGYVGYNASAMLQKVVQYSSVSLQYTQQTGEPTGLGSTSDTRTVAFSFRRFVNGRELIANVSAFDSAGTLDNPTDMRGISATGSIGHPMGRYFSIRAGGGYQRNVQTAQFGFTQKQVFISLRYNDPDFWRFSR